MEPVISTYGLAKSYRGRPALADLNIEVPPGTVFGYLGPNGAGKTTTIRLLTGLLRPTAGRAAILGLDVVRQREAVQQHIGYLPGQFVAYPDLTGEQYLRYLGNLREGVDPSSAARLATRLDMDLTQRIATLSHGNRQKIGIIQAFLNDPEVLILDEPTIGLDPLAQREFLGLVREAREAGRAIFLSSHILSEVEAVADTVAILRQGNLVEVQSVARLKAQALRRIDLTFDDPPPVERLRAIGEVRQIEQNGSIVHVVVEGSTADLLAAAAPYRISAVTTHEPDLEEIFLTYYGSV